MTDDDLLEIIETDYRSRQCIDRKRLNKRLEKWFRKPMKLRLMICWPNRKSMICRLKFLPSTINRLRACHQTVARGLSI